MNQQQVEDKRDKKDEKRHKKLSASVSRSLEVGNEGRKLKKQSIVTSISTGSLSADANVEAMPKISVAMKSLNRSVHQLVKEDLELRPGQRPPTPARQSLPNLLPVGKDLSKSDIWRSGNTEVRRLTLGRSVSPATFGHRRHLSGEFDLNASTKSESWIQGANIPGSSVVHLPPIVKVKTDKIQENRLTVAKKTLEQLDTVLSSEDSLVHLHAHSRPPVHTHT